VLVRPVRHPKEWCWQHQSIFASDQPICQLDSPAWQSQPSPAALLLVAGRAVVVGAVVVTTPDVLGAAADAVEVLLLLLLLGVAVAVAVGQPRPLCSQHQPVSAAPQSSMASIKHAEVIVVVVGHPTVSCLQHHCFFGWGHVAESAGWWQSWGLPVWFVAGVVVVFGGLAVTVSVLAAEVSVVVVVAATVVELAVVVIVEVHPMEWCRQHHVFFCEDQSFCQFELPAWQSYGSVVVDVTLVVMVVVDVAVVATLVVVGKLQTSSVAHWPHPEHSTSTRS